jgi:hypothetical protein
MNEISEQAIIEAIEKDPMEIQFISSVDYSYLFEQRGWQRSNYKKLKQNQYLYFNIKKDPKNCFELYGTFNYSSYYDKLSKELSDSANFLEIGVYQGASLCYLANLRPDINFYGVDPFWQIDWREKQRNPSLSPDQIKANINRLCKKVSLYSMVSEKAPQFFVDEFFDCVFIDAAHVDPYISQDIDMWKPKVKKGGILSGHDYSNAFPDVIKAANRLGNLNLYEGTVWEYIC